MANDFGAQNLSAGTYYLTVRSFDESADPNNIFDYRLFVSIVHA